jgi:hypothetical protein
LLVRHQTSLIAAVWFAAVLAAVLWAWGLEPVVFPAPDEALNRHAAEVIRTTGRPFLKLPFRDPEDLAHLRGWLSLGDYAVPTYPPVTFYLFALLSSLGRPGYFLIAAYPALGAAAFAAGTAELLAISRRWLALLTTLLGFPEIYWMLWPWMNVSLLLACLSWSFFFWARWRRVGATRWLSAALLSVGAAAAVRPDYAAYLFLIALLFSLAASPSEWRRIGMWVIVAGVLAIAPNLILNKVITGHALLAAYQIVLDADPGQSAGQSSTGLLHLLGTLLFPMPLPSPHTAATFLFKYWIALGPLPYLSLGELALIPLLI